MRKNIIMKRGFWAAGAFLCAAAALFLAGALAHAANSPAVSSVNASAAGTSAMITWNTDQVSNSQVAYGTSTNYTASSTLDPSFVLNHSVTISGLSPSTTYHFAVMSMNPGGGAASSSDQTFVTVNATTTNATSTNTATTASTTAPIAANGSLATTGNTPVSGMLNAADTNSPPHSLTFFLTSNPSNGAITDFRSSTGGFTYSPNANFTGSDFFMFGVNNNGFVNSSAATETIVVNAATSSVATSTAATTTISQSDLRALRNEIQELRRIVAILEQNIREFLGRTRQGPPLVPGPPNTGVESGTSMPNAGGNAGVQATIEPQNAVVRAGSSIDFGGRHFGIEEPVVVASNGQVVTVAHADGGGNFSTGSLPVPMATGTKTYTFTGSNSGITVLDTITIIP